MTYTQRVIDMTMVQCNVWNSMGISKGGAFDSYRITALLVHACVGRYDDYMRIVKRTSKGRTNEHQQSIEF